MFKLIEQRRGFRGGEACGLSLAARLPLVSLVLVLTAQLHALDSRLSVSQYLHTNWIQSDGNELPAIMAMAQSSDGYLWLGTKNGLMHFDGFRFVVWEPVFGPPLPGQKILSLATSAQGGLWVGTNSGLCRLESGRIIRYPVADRSAVFEIAETPAKELWFLSVRETKTIVTNLRPDGSAKSYGMTDGLPHNRLLTLWPDEAGNLWLGTESGLCRWRPGSQAVCPASSGVGIVSIVPGATGDLFAADIAGKRVLRFRDGKLEPASNLRNFSPTVRTLFRDRDGNIWAGTTGQGLLKLRDGGFERFTRRDGLSSDMVQAIREDREGNLWVATTRGIDRFRGPEIQRLSTAEGVSSDVISCVEANSRGDVWLGTAGGGLNRIRYGRIQKFALDSGLPSTTVLSLFSSPTGELWAGTAAGVARSAGERFVNVQGPNGASLNQVYAITGDRSGAVWLSDSKAGLVSIQNGAATKITLPESGGRSIYKLQATLDGSLWLGFYEGGLLCLRGGERRTYGPQQGLAEGPVQAIYEDFTGALWVGTKAGLSRFRNGLWTTWTASQNLPGGVQAIVEDAADGLWLVTDSGLIKLDVSKLRKTPDGSPGALTFARYGRGDGVRVSTMSILPSPRITKSKDGEIWIATEDGAAIVDPDRVHGNAIPPGVAIEQVLADGRPEDTITGAKAAFRARELQFTYTALSLTAPEGIRFKYRLDGIDSEWKDAGGKRSVVYVNVPPGNHAFRVIACNSDGVWNNTGAVFSFRIIPHYYQTAWFYALCAAAFGLIFWGAHKVRVHRIVSRYQLIAQERARVTRELHDSLLQGFSGVVYQMEAAAKQFDSNPEMSRERLDRAINQADFSLTEARNALMAMRIPALENSTLPEALAAAGKKFTEGKPIDFHFDLKGRIQDIGYDAQATLYLIGREAINNAVNHSGASLILARVVYSDKEVRLAVQDDGLGFDFEAAMKKQDHWGLAGMQERAKQIGAKFQLETSFGHGTRILLRLERRKKPEKPAPPFPTFTR